MKVWPFLILLVIAFVTTVTRSQSSGSAEDYNNRGLEKQNQGDLDAAIADYSKAISLKPKPGVLATIYNNRANAFMSKNNLDSAIADYTSAIQLQPSEFENYYNRGVAFQTKNSLDLAIADFSKAIELFPRSALAPGSRRSRPDPGSIAGAGHRY